MPCDRNGNQLKEGDIVMLEGRIRALGNSPESYLNVTIVVDEKNPRAQAYTVVSDCLEKVMQKKTADENERALVEAQAAQLRSWGRIKPIE